MAMAMYAGWVLDQVGSYTPIFVVAASAYLLALAVVHWLTPRYEAAKVGQGGGEPPDVKPERASPRLALFACAALLTSLLPLREKVARSARGIEGCRRAV